MTYIADETSVDGGEPIELYEFSSPVLTYRFTSFVEDVIHDTNTYRGIPISRSSLQGGTQEDTPSLEIRMPFNEQMISDYAYNVSPNYLILTIYRMHKLTGDVITYWKGSVSSITIEDKIAKIIIPSILGQKLGFPVPGTYYQGQCNHTLYGSRCSLFAALHKVDTTIVSVSQTAVVVASVGGAAYQHFKAGEILRPADGERRLIINQSSTSLILNHPFPSLEAGQSVSIYAGCDHTPTMCRDKFANIINFGGHPFIPSINIFATGMK